MKIAMSYIDYNAAVLTEREKFSFTKSRIAEIYQNISGYEDIYGAVIISTCNRTEIYISSAPESDYDPFSVLCAAADIKEEAAVPYKTLLNEEALLHLCNLSCGILSQIWGEDQIITQVKEALVFARENKATDSILEVAFRTAVSCGKKVKTVVTFSNENPSVAKAALNVIKQEAGIKKVLVIGNGAMGKLMAETLVKNGYETFITLRRYKYKDTVIPSGSSAVDYDKRYEIMNSVDAVVSATSSPHHTVKYDDFTALESKPRIMIDLAVPRDIESKIYDMETVKCYNIDALSYNIDDDGKKEILEKIENITDKYMNDFYKWYQYKTNMVMKG